MDNPVKEYCRCNLPIKVTYSPKEHYKVPRCSFCMQEVNPSSKAVDKVITKLDSLPSASTRNEERLKDKINEIIDLLKANGAMI